MITSPQSLEIQAWNIDRLVLYARNPRKNDAAVDRMCGSIREFGFKIPVLARSNGEVVDGHLRIKAARKLGSWPLGDTTSIPVILCDEWTDAQVKAFRLMVNRSVAWADWDEELLALELQELNAAEFDLELTGFNPKEIDDLLALPDEEKANDVPPLPENPVSRPGDLWLCGKHRVLCGDSTSAEVVATRIAEFRAKVILDWLQTESESWYMMADLRNIMSGIFSKAQEWEILPDTFANPMRRVKLPRKWEVREKRLLSEEQTVRVLARLDDPHLLICETCLDTGTRISEVTGLQVKHVDLAACCIRIDQRNWRGDIDEPKTAKSKRTLALGALTERYRTWIAGLEKRDAEAWVFPQDEDKSQPMWDSGVRKALKLAAVAEGCDFLGLGPHSLRRANITWRQEVGGSSIETSQIAGHANTKITEEYTIVQLRRQEELTRRIQGKRLKAAQRCKTRVVEIKSSEPAA